MKVTVTSRHVEIGEVMKDYAMAKARRLEHYLLPLRKIEVILAADGEGGFTSKLVASAGRGQVLVAESKGITAAAALDSAAEKLERQLSKCKGKLDHRTGRKGAGKAARPVRENP